MFPGIGDFLSQARTGSRSRERRRKRHWLYGVHVPPHIVLFKTMNHRGADLLESTELVALILTT
jgi:hypothetical protein